MMRVTSTCLLSSNRLAGLLHMAAGQSMPGLFRCRLRNAHHTSTTLSAKTSPDASPSSRDE